MFLLGVKNKYMMIMVIMIVMITFIQDLKTSMVAYLKVRSKF